MQLSSGLGGRLPSDEVAALHRIGWQESPEYALVGSSRDPLQSYLLVGPACACQDFTRGQAPDGWCQHRIAAGIQKRVRELLPLEPAPGGVAPTDTTPPPAAGGTATTAPQGVSSTETPALPEAPASVNVRLQIDGRDCQLTLRDIDEARLLQRLAVVLQQYPAPQPAPQAASQGQGPLSPQQHNAAAMHKRVTDFCPIHNVAMPLNQKEGRSWYSHRLPDGRWCKGK